MDPGGGKGSPVMPWMVLLFVSFTIIGYIALTRGPAVRAGESDPKAPLHTRRLVILLTLSYLESGRDGFYKPQQFYEFGGGCFSGVLPLEELQLQLDEMERERLVEVTTLVMEGKEEVEKAYKLLAAGRRWIEFGPARQSHRPPHGPPPTGGHGA